MSERTSRDYSMSKIEQKVLKNTLQTHKNHLRKKRIYNSVNTSPVNLSGTSSDFQNLGCFELSSIGSAAQFSFTQEIDLSGVSLQITMPHSIQEMVCCAQPGTSLTLPSSKVSLPSLQIASPITLRGSPGGWLEITNGSISVDFSSQSKDTYVSSHEFVLCECSILFTTENVRSDRMSPSPALMVIDAESSNVEVRDCEIKSLRSEGEDICFLCNGPGYGKHPTRASSRYQSILRVYSCDITGFTEVVRAGTNATVILEKSHLYGSKGNCVSAVNPKELTLLQCVIDKSQGSAVDIRLNPSDESSSFTLQQSDIRDNGCYGVNIWSDKLTEVPLKCVISQTKIHHSTREGLAIRHVAFASLEVSSNDFSCNKGTGCWLQKVGGPLSIQLNRSYDSSSGYGFYLYESGADLDGNEAVRNKLGGVMIVGSSGKKVSETPSDVCLRRGCIAYNGENGLTVLDYYNGKVSVENVKITDNFSHGIYLLQSLDVPMLVTASRGKILPDSALRGSCEIHKCSLTRNKAYGLVVNKFKCVLNNADFTGNTLGAVQLSEGSEQCLTGARPDQEELNSDVNVHKNDKVCGSMKCSIF